MFTLTIHHIPLEVEFSPSQTSHGYCSRWSRHAEVHFRFQFVLFSSPLVSIQWKALHGVNVVGSLSCLRSASRFSQNDIFSVGSPARRYLGISFLTFGRSSFSNDGFRISGCLLCSYSGSYAYIDGHWRHKRMIPVTGRGSFLSIRDIATRRQD